MKRCLVALLLWATAQPFAQGPVTLPRRPLPDAPLVIDTAEQKIRVTALKGLSHPWSLAFLPDGGILVTERNAGRLRLVRNGMLDPQAISGVPPVFSVGLAGLMEVVLHPKFVENHLAL